MEVRTYTCVHMYVYITTPVPHFPILDIHSTPLCAPLSLDAQAVKNFLEHTLYIPCGLRVPYIECQTKVRSQEFKINLDSQGHCELTLAYPKLKLMALA